MLVDFIKMNGAGNDFILIDNRNGHLSLTTEQIVRLCHRQKGIGADGLILLKNCKSGQADFAWGFYNSDGSEAEMCGNGSRCFARFIQTLVPDIGPTVSFETISGIIHAEFLGDQVKVELTQPHSLSLNIHLSWEDQTGEVHFLNTGVPHTVCFVDDIESVPVKKWGEALRYHPYFSPKGTNVNFAQRMPDGSIRVRTYERGVEGETLACGTGVTATALVSAAIFHLQSPVKIHTRGGDILQVGFVREGAAFKNVTLTGPAEIAFRGQVEI